jgi:hypothetical protein
MSAQYVGEVAPPQASQFAGGEFFGEQVRDERDRNARVRYLDYWDTGIDRFKMFQWLCLALMNVVVAGK